MRIGRLIFAAAFALFASVIMWRCIATLIWTKHSPYTLIVLPTTLILLLVSTGYITIYIFVTELRYGRGGVKATSIVIAHSGTGPLLVGPLRGRGRCLIEIRAAAPKSGFWRRRRLHVEPQVLEGQPRLSSTAVQHRKRQESYEIRVRSDSAWAISLSVRVKEGTAAGTEVTIQARGPCILYAFPQNSGATPWR